MITIDIVKDIYEITLLKHGYFLASSKMQKLHLQSKTDILRGANFKFCMHNIVIVSGMDRSSLLFLGAFISMLHLKCLLLDVALS